MPNTTIHQNNVARLTSLQRQRLIDGINTLSIKTILPYFLSGEITFADTPHIDAERKSHIQDCIAKMPNPQEQREWAEIAQQLANPTKELLTKIDLYISHWNNISPSGNNLELAIEKKKEIEAEIKSKEAEAEREDWQNVDIFSIDSLEKHILKYPFTAHLKEIDESIWALVDKNNIYDLDRYAGIFPSGEHIAEVEKLRNSIVEWNKVKNSEDIFYVNQYIMQNPTSPYIGEAEVLKLKLKQREFADMRNNPNTYIVERLIRLIDENIVSEYELIKAGVTTSSILSILREGDIYLPDINYAIEQSVAECKPGYTDVFFFGIPSTGKTCILMGLSRSSSLHINLASGGGDYASALQQYTDVGKTVPRTPGTFVTTLETEINQSVESNAVHKVNLVEMSGEEFAIKIVNNPEHIFTFEDMGGEGAPYLLNNENRKVFFLIIDPTVNIVRFSKEEKQYDEQTGVENLILKHYAVNQSVVIDKLVCMFREKGNAEIMKRVDSIHIIMTKSDTLGAGDVEREEKALKIFEDRYQNNILSPLIDLCKEYNINVQTNFRPKLYTFSLGTFYVGGLYEYESSDSDRLVKVISNSTRAFKKISWWDKIKKVLNQ